MLRILFLSSIAFLIPGKQKTDFTPKEALPVYEVKKAGQVSEELAEISGWIFANDSTLIAHNDGGNGANLFVLKTDGTIIHRCRLNAVNVDWEDIAYDGKSKLYIGDIGNNNNTRKDLKIYIVDVSKVLSGTVAEPDSITFTYPEQTAFPPENKELYYDAEALTFHNDSLWIFTKCRTKPFDGKSMIYKLPAKPGDYKAERTGYIVPGKTTWLKDGITAAEIVGKELFVTTYNRMVVYDFDSRQPKQKQEVILTPLSQKEAIAIRKDGTIFIVDERQKIIGGGKIITLTKKK